MSLELTLGSLLAIMALGWLASKLFPNTGALDADKAKRNMLRYEPDAVVEDILIGENGLSALLALRKPAEAVGLVRQFGDRVVCRVITKGDLRKVYKDHARLTLTFRDFTQPEVTLVLTGDSLKRAVEILDAITRIEETSHAAA